MQRPGFERLVAMVCSGDVGAVYCIEASRLSRWMSTASTCKFGPKVLIETRNQRAASVDFTHGARESARDWRERHSR
jgi:hypothetical protein